MAALVNTTYKEEKKERKEQEVNEEEEKESADGKSSFPLHFFWLPYTSVPSNSKIMSHFSQNM